MVVIRNPGNYLNLVRDQYGLLRDAVEGFYGGYAAKANDVAVRIRTLVHNTGESRALLSFVAANYLELLIYHKATTDDPTTVMVLNQRMRISGDGTITNVRENFESPFYRLVPLHRWWMEEYLVIGTIRSSKKQIVLDVANKDGGAHVDDVVPLRHAVASQPPVVFGTAHGFVRPNLARTTVAQAGSELLNYIERNFPGGVSR